MPRRNHTIALALVVAAALTAVEAESVHAEIYKTIDTDGRVTYSNAPMPGAITTDLIDNPPAPSEEDVRAAQEAYRHIETLGAEMEKRRLQLEEQRARLHREERVLDAYLQQSRAPVLGYDVPWVHIIESESRRKHFDRSSRLRDGKRHGRSDRVRIGTDRRSSSLSSPEAGRPRRGR